MPRAETVTQIRARIRKYLATRDIAKTSCHRAWLDLRPEAVSQSEFERIFQTVRADAFAPASGEPPAPGVATDSPPAAPASPA